KLFLLVDAVVIAPARDPRAACGTAAIAEVQVLVEHAPIGLALHSQTQRALRVLKAVSRTVRAMLSVCLFCLFFVYYPFPERPGHWRTPYQEVPMESSFFDVRRCPPTSVGLAL